MPAIMLGTKSWWPGASSRRTRRAGDSKKVEATSTVTPRARSSGRSSSSHAQAKEPLPAALASLSALWAAFWLTCLQTQGMELTYKDTLMSSEPTSSGTDTSTSPDLRQLWSCALLDPCGVHEKSSSLSCELPRSTACRLAWAQWELQRCCADRAVGAAPQVV